MGRPPQIDEVCWVIARFAKPSDRNRFVLDARSIGTDVIRVESTGELELRVQASVKLRSAALALLFAHGGQVIADQEKAG